MKKKRVFIILLLFHFFLDMPLKVEESKAKKDIPSYPWHQVLLNTGIFYPSQTYFRKKYGGPFFVSLFYKFRLNNNFRVKTGAWYWHYNSRYLSRGYHLRFLNIPFSMEYIFFPGENTIPYFGVGIANVVLIEKFGNSKKIFYAPGYTYHFGFDYQIIQSISLNFEINYLRAQILKIDNMNIGGYKTSLGIGFNF